MIKFVKPAALFMSIAMLTAACGGGGTAPGGTSSTGSDNKAQETPKEDKKVTISFIHWRGEDTKVFDEIIADFTKKHPNIGVEMSVFPSEQYLANAQAKLIDGKVGDVFASFPGAQFNTLHKAGLYEDLSGASFKGNFSDNLIKAASKDGKQYAFPYQLVYNQPIYNKAVFEKLGLKPAEDWDGFLALCEQLKKNGYTPIAFPGADIGPGQFVNTMMMNNNTDEDIWNKVETGQAKLTDEWFVKTLSQFKELNDKGYFQANSIGTSKDIAGSLFAQEKAAMLATGSYMMATNKQQNPNLSQGLLAPITVSKDKAVFQGVHTTTFMLGVNARSSKKDAAKTFLAYLSEKEVAEKYANATGQLVTVKDVKYKTPELEESAKWADKKTRFQPRYLISVAAIEKAVTASIQNVINGLAPKEAAAQAQQIVDQNLKK
ncbi:ABC transporter substrate-binding protein [Paenibacillus sp. YYML68]|uniref:ABC transporter substrate-binding protein n=1 Tax=Paenibacillus sp. YYML68 TaxID=2909250 RepID=UPI0024914209|nr:extracellular solute-binding protein [Paenibacillus sp. YYML68]